MDRNHNNRRALLLEIKSDALLLQHNMSSHLLAEALYAQTEYDRLVEQFHTDYPQWCLGDAYKTAKRDFDAFVRLLDAAIEGESQE